MIGTWSFGAFYRRHVAINSGGPVKLSKERREKPQLNAAYNHEPHDHYVDKSQVGKKKVWGSTRQKAGNGNG